MAEWLYGNATRSCHCVTVHRIRGICASKHDWHNNKKNALTYNENVTNLFLFASFTQTFCILLIFHAARMLHDANYELACNTFTFTAWIRRAFKYELKWKLNDIFQVTSSPPNISRKSLGKKSTHESYNKYECVSLILIGHALLGAAIRTHRSF